MDQATSNAVLMGRPFGGVAMLVHNDLTTEARCLLIKERYIIVKVCGTLFVNVYFPCNSHVPAHHELLCVTLDEINDELAKYPALNIVMAGDMNADLRLTSLGATTIRNFTIANNLIIACDRVALAYDCTYFNDVQGHSSMLDFFILSPGMFSDLVGIMVCDDPSNLSDLVPVELTIKSHAVLTVLPEPAANSFELLRNKRLRWDKANLNNYYNLSYTALSNTLSNLDRFYHRISHEANIDPARSSDRKRS